MIELNKICAKCQGTGMHQGLSCLKCSGLGYLEKSGLVLIPPVFWATEIYEQVDYEEIAQENRDAYAIMMSTGIINLTPGSKMRTEFWEIFGAESTTRANLTNLLGE